MNKLEYINRVQQHLQILSEEERKDAVQYLEEYFEEAGEDNEQQVISDLGAPAKYAAQIKAESAIREGAKTSEHQKPNTQLKRGFMIAGGILALPIALPLLLALVCVLLALALLLVSFIIVMGALVLVSVVVAIPMLGSSIAMFSTDMGDGLLSLGLSLGMIGVSILFILLFYLPFSRFIPWINRIIAKLFKRLKGAQHEDTQ